MKRINQKKWIILFLATFFVLSVLVSNNCLSQIKSAIGNSGGKMIIEKYSFKESKNTLSFLVMLNNKNGSGKIQSGDVCFELQDYAGKSYELSPSVKKPKLSLDAIDPGKYSKGWVSFKVTKDVKLENLKIRYSSGKENQTEWVQFAFKRSK